jgi:hypothetical protein
MPPYSEFHYGPNVLPYSTTDGRFGQDMSVNSVSHHFPYMITESKPTKITKKPTVSTLGFYMSLLQKIVFDVDWKH